MVMVNGPIISYVSVLNSDDNLFDWLEVKSSFKTSYIWKYRTQIYDICLQHIDTGSRQKNLNFCYSAKFKLHNT